MNRYSKLRFSRAARSFVFACHDELFDCLMERFEAIQAGKIELVRTPLGLVHLDLCGCIAYFERALVDDGDEELVVTAVVSQ